MIELLKAVLFGIVEGVTEWLPVSSTGHLILLNEFVKLNVSEEFNSMFDVVIQLGAILAVIVLFFHKLNPFAPSKSAVEKKQSQGALYVLLPQSKPPPCVSPGRIAASSGAPYLKSCSCRKCPDFLHEGQCF